MAELKPEARAYIMTRVNSPISGKYNFQVLEVTNFISITTKLTMSGVSTATVVLDNSRDQMFYQEKKSQFLDIMEWKNLQTRTGLVQYIKPERNEARASSSGKDVAQALLSKALGKFTSGAAKSLYFANTWLLPFDAMNKIWIDFKGRDGNWYAGFTGIICTITDSFTAGGTPTITLSCKDYRRFFETTMLTTQEGIAPVDRTYQDMIQQANSTKTFSYADYQNADLIIRQVLDTVNKSYTKEGLRIAGADADVWFGKPFWKLPGVVGDSKKGRCVRTYLGVSNLRPDNPRQSLLGTNVVDTTTNVLTNLKGVLGRIKISANLLSAVPLNPGFNYENESIYYVDKAFDELGFSLDNVQAMIRASFQLWMNERMTASAVIQRVVESTFFDTYQDAMGNFIFQMPKYDRFPFATPLQDTKQRDIELYIRTTKSSPVKRKQQYQQYHGINYVIGDESLQSWNFALNESAIRTMVGVTGTPDYAPTSADLVAKCYTDYAFASSEDVVRYGIRTQLLQCPFLKTQDPKKGKIYAEQVLRMLNAMKRTGTVNLIQRPDLQLGRTVYILERDMLYYVHSVSNNYRQGGEHTTNLELSFGHAPDQSIGNPFQMLTDLVVTGRPKGQKTNGPLASKEKLADTLKEGAKKVSSRPLKIPGIA